MKQYRTHGVCSRLIELDVQDGVIRSVKFTGGCHGNLQGICKLVEGMDAKEAIRRLRGIDCGGRGTSCPDQLARALAQEIEE